MRDWGTVFTFLSPLDTVKTTVSQSSAGAFPHRSSHKLDPLPSPLFWRGQGVQGLEGQWLRYLWSVHSSFYPLARCLWAGSRHVGPSRPHLAGAVARRAELLPHLLLGIEYSPFIDELCRGRPLGGQTLQFSSCIVRGQRSSTLLCSKMCVSRASGARIPAPPLSMVWPRGCSITTPCHSSFTLKGK